MGKKNIHPNAKTGHHVVPNEWDKLIADKNTVLVDTRNNYESKIGTFKDSILVNSSNFTEFPEWVKKNKKKLKIEKLQCSAQAELDVKKQAVISGKMVLKMFFSLMEA